MSEKLKNKIIDRYQKKRTDKTRVHDKALAEDMAYAEKPYRDAALAQKEIGMAAVGEVWSRYPDTTGTERVSVSDVAQRTDHNEDDIAHVLTRGSRSLAHDLYVKADKTHPYRKLKKVRNQAAEIFSVDPDDMSMSQAQQIGHHLVDKVSQTTVESGIKAAEIVQQRQERSAESREERV